MLPGRKLARQNAKASIRSRFLLIVSSFVRARWTRIDAFRICVSIAVHDDEAISIDQIAYDWLVCGQIGQNDAGMHSFSCELVKDSHSALPLLLYGPLPGSHTLLVHRQCGASLQKCFDCSVASAFCFASGCCGCCCSCSAAFRALRLF